MTTLVPFSPKRIEAILDSDDPAAAVAAMPEQDLYYLIKDAGIAEAAPLVALAPPEKVQTFLDLDVWSDDRLDDRLAVPWLSALLDAGPERLAFVWRQLDPEETALLLQRWTRIYNLAEEEVPDDEEPPFVPTPDRFFLLKVTSDDPEVAALVERLIDRLYRADPELARHTIRAADSEPAAELEETAYRFRQNRMHELGYAPFLEALEVYRPLDPSAIHIGEDAPEAPPDVPLSLAVADAVRRPPFLTQALAAVDEDAELRRLEAALAVLLNEVLAADRVSPGDLEAARDGALLGAGTLSIGLETVARGQPARGVEALRRVPLGKLHRVGAGVLAKLQAAARALGRPRVEEPHASVLAALVIGRPRYSRALDDPPQGGARPFLQLGDVRKVTDLLARLQSQIDLVGRVLHADPATYGPAATIGDLGRTAVLRAALGQPMEVKPVSPEDVLAYLRRPQIPAIPPALREFAPTIEGWMRDIERELRDVSRSEPPDPRFLAGFLIVNSQP
ncbi:MAG TPA: DUF6178 family protein [Haliangiales bacterium]|nr:DUF6178 family protein [Haliangiales bacterium]